MNSKLYRLVFSRVRGGLVATAENAASSGKSGAGESCGGDRRGAAPAFVLSGLALAAGAAFGQALPTGASVQQGAAQVSSAGAAMVIHQTTPRLVTDWQSFSIGAGHSVQFVQPSTASVALNRVTGHQASILLGSLSANGHVYLQNPAGVLFAPGAQVNVGALVATTLQADLAAFQAGQLRLSGGESSTGAVVNQGSITTPAGGHVVLAGPQVGNAGTISTLLGTTALAAGNAVEVDPTGAGLLSIRIPVAALGAHLSNTGSISADGGLVALQAAASEAALRTVMQVDGVVRARSIEQRDGQIVLSGGPSGVVAVTGTLDARGTGGTDTRGGSIKVLGERVALLGSARLDASGDVGGGTVLVGGGLQGQDPDVPNSQAVYFAPTARIAADATSAGDGGRIVLWSDQATRAYGGLSARGGALGGNGGFIETSGGWLDARPATVDTAAPRGRAGTWLLDPHDITINDAGPDVGYDASFTAIADNSVISTGAIKSQLETGSNVTISTGGGIGGQTGNITMAGATLLVNSSGPGALTLIADGSISLSGSTIESQFGAMDISLLASRKFDGGITLLNSSIVSADGNITLGGYGIGSSVTGSFNGAYSQTGPGIQISNSTVNAGTGNLGGSLTLAGASGTAAGVLIDGNSVLRAQALSIQGSSTGGDGVDIVASSLTTTAGLGIEGVGAQIGVSVDATSALLSSPGVAGSSSLSLVGASTGSANGVRMAGSLTANNGNSVSISAANTAGSTDALRVTGAITVGSAPGSLTLGIINPAIDNSILLDGATLVGTAGGILMFGASTLTLQDTTVSGRTMQLQADNIRFAGASSLVSNTPSGDVFVLTNRNNGPLTSFVNDSTVGVGGAGALQTSGAPARWIIWAADIASSAFSPGALPYDYTLYGVTGASDWANYPGNGYVSASTGVVTLTGSVASRVYDASVSVPAPTGVQGTGPRGVVADITSAPGYQYADKNVGTAKPIDLFGSYSATYADALGKPAYGLALASGLTGDITPATLVLQGLSGVDKTYDATPVATYTGTPSVTPLGSDSVGVSLPGGAAAFFADKNVGTGKPITIPSLGLTGADAGNYLLSNAGLTASILPFQLSLAGASIADKVYDQTVTATLSGASGANFYAGDNVALTGGVATFADQSAGVNKPVQVSGFGLTGSDAGNYLAPAPTVLQATILPATLTLSGLSATDKVYDGTTLALLSGTASITPLAGDAVSLIGSPVGIFDDKNVGIAKPVSVFNVGLTGSDAPNYVVVGPSNLTASITPATLVVSGLSAVDKVYDATPLARLTGSASVTPLGDDVVALSATPVGSFSDKNVGSAKPVSISALSLLGPDAGNYVLSTSGGLSASITPAPLAIVGLSASDKVYDASTVATLAGTPGVTPLGSDVVGVGAVGSASFADKNVGLDKPVSLAAVSLTGADAGNYTPVAPTGLAADITPRVLAPTGISALNRGADPSTSIVGLDTAGAALPGVLPGDSVALVTSGATGSVGSPDAGTGKTVAVSGLALAGPDARNYALSVGANGLPINNVPLLLGITVTLYSPLIEAFEEVRDKEYVQGVSDAQEPFRRALAEALAAGFGKENIRKQLQRGLVYETGPAAPAVDTIAPARKPASCRPARGSNASSLSCNP